MNKKTHLILEVTREYPSNPKALKDFVKAYEARFEQSILASPLSPLQKGQSVPGLESYLPLFFPEGMASFFDYLPDSTLWLTPDNDTLKTLERTHRERAEARSAGQYIPHLSPKELLLSKDELFSGLKRFERVGCSEKESRGITSAKSALKQFNALDKRQSEAIAHLLSQKIKICLFSATSGRTSVLLDNLKKAKLTPHLSPQYENIEEDKHANLTLATAECLEGYYDPSHKVLFLSDGEFGYQQVVLPTKLSQLQHQFEVGDYVVHPECGIGIYQGLALIEDEGERYECLKLEYRGGTEIFVDIDEVGQIYPYESKEDSPIELSELGNKQWQKLTDKTRKHVEDITAKLLLSYAKRQASGGFAFPINESHYQAFADTFPYTETDDQQAAINALLGDMRASVPMNRLLCGDVGLGKTEVAMRGLFVALDAGKQSAVLVPTTLLCEQHFERINERFSPFAARIAMLSRFQSAGEVREIRRQLLEGKVDIVVGTHALLSKETEFKDLGFLVIDEEQRFGVLQKERVRTDYSHVDTLTMTATPIPRTLQLAMSEWQSLSLIVTPPKHRLPIRTFLVGMGDEKIMEAIQREVGRGGQAFFLYNDVMGMKGFVEGLQSQLGEEISIGMVHGQMSESEIERVMTAFHQHRYSLLVASTIIETGIDIPNANTILIHRADKLGLAQLHQLRGRVGRSHQQAYCYLVTPPPSLLKKSAKKRIEALLSHQALGSGFQLATEDLEIRGAGDFLSDKQSGHIKSVGFGFYMRLVNDTIRKIKAGQLDDSLLENISNEENVVIRVPKYIPASYIEDPTERLHLYQSLVGAEDLKSLESIAINMISRHGEAPKEVHHLLRYLELKYWCREAGVQNLTASLTESKKEVVIQFKVSHNISVDLILQWVESGRVRMKGAEQVVFYLSNEDMEAAEKISEISHALSNLLIRKP